jgi:hypothetical protein
MLYVDEAECVVALDPTLRLRKQGSTGTFDGETVVLYSVYQSNLEPDG